MALVVALVEATLVELESPPSDVAYIRHTWTNCTVKLFFSTSHLEKSKGWFLSAQPANYVFRQRADRRMVLDPAMQKLVKVAFGILQTSVTSPADVLDPISIYIHSKRNIVLGQDGFGWVPWKFVWLLHTSSQLGRCSWLMCCVFGYATDDSHHVGIEGYWDFTADICWSE